MGIGMALAPARTYRAFARGRRASNFYGMTLDDRLLEQSVAGARQNLGLAGPAGKVELRDVLSFTGWAVLAIVFASLPFVAVGGLLFAAVSRYLGAS